MSLLLQETAFMDTKRDDITTACIQRYCFVLAHKSTFLVERDTAMILFRRNCEFVEFGKDYDFLWGMVLLRCFQSMRLLQHFLKRKWLGFSLGHRLPSP